MTAAELSTPAPIRGRGRRVVLVLWTLTVGGSVAMLVATISAAGELDAGSLQIGLGMFAVIAALFTSMGALIEIRRPGNRVGWLMAAIGPLMLVTFSGFLLGAHGAATEGLAARVSAVAAWAGGMGIAPFVFAVGPLMAATFPDGRLPSRRWRAPVVLVAASLVMADLLAAFLPGPVQSGMPDNPFGIEALRSLSFLGDASALLLTAGFLAGVLLAVAAVIARFRRSRGLEREQMKWFVAAIAAIGVTTPLSVFDGSSAASVFDFALIGSIGLVPIAVGIAVTRYRLYEIDTIINRALVYGLLTAILAGGSAAAIGLTQRTFAGVLGSGDTTIIVTTLIVVAAFDPLKKRLQALVDRRFKETRDPAAIVALFAEELEQAPWQVDRRRAAMALLRTLVAATAATSARVVVRNDPHDDLAVAIGEDPFEGTWSMRVSSADVALEIELGLGRGGSAPDPETLRPAVERLLAQLA